MYVRRLFANAKATSSLTPSGFQRVSADFSAGDTYCELVHSHADAPLTLFSTALTLEPIHGADSFAVHGLGWASVSRIEPLLELPPARARGTLAADGTTITTWVRGRRLSATNKAARSIWTAVARRAARKLSQQLRFVRNSAAAAYFPDFHMWPLLGLFRSPLGATEPSWGCATNDATRLAESVAELHLAVADLTTEVQGSIPLRQEDSDSRYFRSIERLTKLAQTHRGFEDLTESLIAALTTAHGRMNKCSLVTALSTHGLRDIDISGGRAVLRQLWGLRLTEMENIAAAFAHDLSVRGEASYSGVSPEESIERFTEQLSGAGYPLDAFAMRVFRAHQLIRTAHIWSSAVHPYGDEKARHYLLEADRLLAR